jgi:hypothetical protein
MEDARRPSDSRSREEEEQRREELDLEMQERPMCKINLLHLQLASPEEHIRMVEPLG